MWAGLMLRAEEIERRVWWWALYDERTGQVTATRSVQPCCHRTEKRRALRWRQPPGSGSCTPDVGAA